MLLGSQSLVNDPYYNDVVLLLRGYDATSGQVFKDYSKYNRTITANGNVAHSTNQKKYSNSSIYFDGSGDYLTVPASTDFSFGTGDFTVEALLYYVPLTTINGRIIVDPRPDNTNGAYWAFGISPSGQVGSITLPTNQWMHFAATRSSGNLKQFVNGIVSYDSVNTDNFSSNVIKIGANAFRSTAPDTYFNGYIDDLRITKGVARYTANFTPPIQPFLNW